MNLAILIPAYNESFSIQKTIQEAKKYCDLIIVGDDASTDATAEFAEKAGAIVARATQNQGYDGALNLAFSEAKKRGATHVITFDADGQHPAHQIPDYIKAFQRCDLVLGIRPKKARVMETVFGCVTQFLFKVQDPMCGMKGFNLATSFPSLNEISQMDSTRSTNTELMIRYLEVGASMCQIPLSIRDREDTVSRFGSSLRGNWRILNSMIRVFRTSKISIT